MTDARSPTKVKATGAHFTPPGLARFLARLALDHVNRRGSLSVLDPACGDGRLLHALAEEAGPTRLQMVGVDQDGGCCHAANERLRSMPGVRISTRHGDFLRLVTENDTLGRFDLVIANPPYVRTQVLGAEVSRRLARELGLSGRVDLYHAFIAAMTRVLAPGGTLALLCSNRFLTTRSGRAVRATLRSQFQLERILDLGDTKLFGAAVLPAIVIARRTNTPRPAACAFVRAYEVRDGSATIEAARAAPPILAALHSEQAELARRGGALIRIERGTLATGHGDDEPWTLSSARTEAWLARIRERTARTFGDVGKIRVGIKTTADRVFIRPTWGDLDESVRPEPVLLRPLITHECAGRWRTGDPQREVLYPHAVTGGKRSAVDLARFPRARTYLEQHREHLERRRYVIDAGREWYEIWVPQDPGAWAAPKIVWPDISEAPRFGLDESGAVVNGDCYWLTLHEGLSEDWLSLLLGVANSSLAVRFYDAVCGNRLYAGRRRFITQYVARFPLPDLEHPSSRAVVRAVRDLVANPAEPESRESDLDALVERAFDTGDTVSHTPSLPSD